MTELPKIVRQRLRAQASGRVDVHPDADLLTAFGERTLAESERQQVMAHLSLCADCRETVALAAPPQVTEPGQLRPARVSRRLGWVHWFALAASVVVVATAVLQLPRSGQPPSTELQVATREVAPVTAPKPQAEPEAGKLADKITTINGSAVATQQERAAAESDDSRAPSKTPAASQPPKRDEAASKPVLYGNLYENKQQARTPAQPATGLGRAAGIESRPGVAGGIAGSVPGGIPAGKIGGVAVPSVGSSADSARRDAPQAPPPPAAVRENELAAIEENRRPSSQSSESKDAEAKKFEAAAVTPEPARQRAEAETTQVAGGKEAAGQLADQQALDADEKSRKTAAASESVYVQPGTLPMKMHPTEKAAVAAETQGGSLTSRLAHKLKAPLRWTVSAAGMVRRSLDGGKSWQDVSITQGARFRAVAALDGKVWAGGEGGALFHSSDAGQTWIRQSLSGAGNRLEMAPAFDIVRIDVTASGQVTVVTSQHQTFVSTDAGKTWSRH